MTKNNKAWYFQSRFKYLSAFMLNFIFLFGQSIQLERTNMESVDLLSGAFRHAMHLDSTYILQYDVDRLLAGFRREAGLPPKAEIYGGWESESLAGHILGHYLSAAAQMVVQTNSQVFHNRINYILEELEACQLTMVNHGYIGAAPGARKVFEEEVKKGIITATGFNLNGIWSPLYTYHKIMAGLRDVYHLLGSDKALQIENRFADWMVDIFSPLSELQMQELMICEYGGINETLADLFSDTRDSQYLELAEKFYDKVILDSLAESIDILPGNHGNTQVPKLIGLVKLYKITGKQKYWDAAWYFWQRVVYHHSYVTGGHGNHEYFGQPDQLRDRLSDETTETCNVYNMLKLTGFLVQYKPQAALGDFYERALFNHILSSQNPDDGRLIYNLSLEMGGQKDYQDPEWFTCCIGSGMENHGKYDSDIYYKTSEKLYINQFIASELNWSEQKVRIRQETRFPEEQSSTIKIIEAQSGPFTILIRKPYWVDDTDFVISLNGERASTGMEDGFASILYNWKQGDVLKVQMPFHLRKETMPDDEHRVAIMYGPLVLAGHWEEAKLRGSGEKVPVILATSPDPDDWLEASSTPNSFHTVEGGHPIGVDFKPFYQIQDETYSIYFDVFDSIALKRREMWRIQEKQRRADIEAATIDLFQPGDSISEVKHAFIGKNTDLIVFKDRKARLAHREGWLSFELFLKDSDPENIKLLIDYWGGFTGSKTFDILIDDHKIATENISGKKDGHFIDIEYDIPEHLLTGKEKIKVAFMPHAGSRAGPFFAARFINTNI